MPSAIISPRRMKDQARAGRMVRVRGMARRAQGGMIGWNTNVLLRLVFADDPGQARAVRGNFDAFSKDGIRIDRIVLVEAVRVLRRVHRLDRAQVVGLLERMMATSGLHIDRRGAVMIAIRRYRPGPGDFSDHLIAVLNDEAGCGKTFTFDKRAARSGVFELMKSNLLS